MELLPLRGRVASLVLVAFTLIATEVYRVGSPELNLAFLLSAAALLLLIVVVERLDVSVNVGSGQLLMSFGTPLALAASIHFGVATGALIVLFGHLIDSSFARRDILKSATNISLYVIAGIVGGRVYWALADSSLSAVSTLQNVASLMAASVAFVIVSTVLFSYVFAPVMGVGPISFIRSHLPYVGLDLISVPTLSGMVSVLAATNALAVLLLLLPILAPQLAFRTLRQAQGEIRDTIESLVDALEVRDSQSAHHSQRVQQYVRIMAHELESVPEQLLDEILVAARIHDIGKVGTRDDMLKKTGALTESERAAIQVHPDIGASLVSRLRGFEHIASMVRHHHERWDGHGYPHGLSGSVIPLGSRLIALADTYDAMTNDRPYRRALSHTEALAEIGRHAGTQFDPELATLFVRVMQREHAVPIGQQVPLGHVAAT